MAELASKTPPLIPPEEAEEKAASIWSESWKSFKKNKMAIIGLSLVIFFILLAIFAPIIAPYSFEEQNLSNKHLSPSAEHWFGTDEFGRDIFSRIIFGSRLSLSVGFLSVAGSVVIGSLLGIIAGYYGKWIDAIICRIFDILLAFPSILLAIAIVAVLGPSLKKCFNCHCYNKRTDIWPFSPFPGAYGKGRRICNSGKSNRNERSAYFASSHPAKLLSSDYRSRFTCHSISHY